MADVVPLSEHPVPFEKKARMFIIAGRCVNHKTNSHYFWFAIHRYGELAASVRRQPELKAKNITDITKYRKEFEPPKFVDEKLNPEWVTFMKDLPEKAYQEGRVVGPYMDWWDKGGTEVVIGKTLIPHDIIKPSGTQADTSTVVGLIKQIRGVLWELPIPSFDYLSSSSTLAKDIIEGLKNKVASIKYSEIQTTIEPEYTVYCAVATGEVAHTEQEIISIIKDYLEALEPMQLVASLEDPYYVSRKKDIRKDVLEGNLDAIQLLDPEDREDRIVLDRLAEKGNPQAIKVLEDYKSTFESWEKILSSKRRMNMKKIAQEAALPTPAVSVPTVPPSTPEIDIALPKVETQSLQTPTIPDNLIEQQILESIDKEVSPESVQPDTAVETEFTQNAPQSDAVSADKAEKDILADFDIDPVPADTPQFDEISLDDMKGMIQNMKLRISQGEERKQFERALEKAEKAKKYLDAYNQWLEAAHSEFGDKPIKIKL